MKRSIVSFIILTVVILLGAGGELIYSSLLSNKITDTISECQTLENDEKINKCRELYDYIEKHEGLNELFLSRKMLEKITIESKGICIYLKNHDDTSFEISLAKLETYAKDIYGGGVF